MGRLIVPVHLVVEGGPWRGVSRVDVARRARAMLAALQMDHAELSILLTGDDQIRNLNRIYRRKNRPTDVLAFAQREGEHGERAGRLLGDVVVSIPTARRQAEAAGRPMDAELTMLLAHGLLHLLGWDHATSSQDRRMRRETKRLCAAADAPRRARPSPVAPADRVKRLKGGILPTANGDSVQRTASRRGR